MLQYIIGGLAIVTLSAIGIWEHFESETKSAKRDYEKAKIKYFSTVNELRKEINEVKKEIQELYNPFEHLLPLYIRSFKTADDAYKAKSNINNVIKSTYNSINEINNKMNILYTSTKNRISSEEKEKIHLEIQELKQLKQALYADVNNNISERDNFLLKVKQFNNETHKLKLYIRDNCGDGGRIWYERLEERIKAKRKT